MRQRRIIGLSARISKNVHLARPLKNDPITFTVVPKHGILAKMPGIQSLARKMARRRNRSTVPTALGNPAKDAGFPNFPSTTAPRPVYPQKSNPPKSGDRRILA
jgi:hypothetical protein